MTARPETRANNLLRQDPTQADIDGWCRHRSVFGVAETARACGNAQDRQRHHQGCPQSAACHGSDGNPAPFSKAVRSAWSCAEPGALPARLDRSRECLRTGVASVPAEGEVAIQVGPVVE